MLKMEICCAVCQVSSPIFCSNFMKIGIFRQSNLLKRHIADIVRRAQSKIECFRLKLWLAVRNKNCSQCVSSSDSFSFATLSFRIWRWLTQRVHCCSHHQEYLKWGFIIFFVVINDLFRCRPYTQFPISIMTCAREHNKTMNAPDEWTADRRKELHFTFTKWHSTSTVGLLATTNYSKTSKTENADEGLNGIERERIVNNECNGNNSCLSFQPLG